MNLSGHDPYDALRGRRIPKWVRNYAWSRMAAIQVRKRLPWDLSGFLKVQPFVMAKTAACWLIAASRSLTSHERAAARMDAALAAMDAAEGSLGGGRWGYEFDVQTRWAFYPRGMPNIIATAFCGRALATAGLVLARDDLLGRVSESCEWIEREMLRPVNPPWIQYVPTSRTLVHNANLLGAGLLTAGGRILRCKEWVADGLAACMTSVSLQWSNGGWPYGEKPGLGWEDSFHTAYCLDGLLQVWLCTGDSRIASALERGVERWTRRFFGDEGEPFYSPNHRLPYDIHSAATAVDVGSRLATWGMCDTAIPEKVYAWSLANLVDSDTGLTYYRRGRVLRDRRHFVRWGDAHWQLASSSLALLRTGQRDPLEQALRSPETTRHEATGGL